MMRAFDRLITCPVGDLRLWGSVPLIVSDESMKILASGKDKDFFELVDRAGFILVPPFRLFAVDGCYEGISFIALCRVDSVDDLDAKGEEWNKLLSTFKNPPSDTRWVYKIKVATDFGMKHLTYPVAFPMDIYIPVASDGTADLQQGVNALWLDDTHQIEAMDKFAKLIGMDFESWTQKAPLEILAFAAHTISLMNCRNVELVDNPLNRQQRRRNERGQGIKTHSYYTLKIKPMRKEYEPTGEGEKGHKHRLHIMRGHFKTYTDDSPLFGKYTGTYYWGASVRGNAEKGTIKKDYEVVK